MDARYYTLSISLYRVGCTARRAAGALLRS